MAVHKLNSWKYEAPADSTIQSEASKWAHASIAQQEIADRVVAELANVRQRYGEIEIRMTSAGS